jgi:hypothetical protein
LSTFRWTSCFVSTAIFSSAIFNTGIWFVSSSGPHC